MAKIEFERCRDYSLGRLVVILERIHRQQKELTCFDPERWLEDRTIWIRRAYKILGFMTEVQETPIWFTYPATRTLVLYPEWPNTPYLKIDSRERSRRIEPFQAAVSKEDQRAQLEWLLNPLNTSTGEKTILQISIPKNQTHEQLVEAFKAVLKIYFPGQGKPYRKSSGRGSAQATVIDDLNALAVCWLCKIAKRRRAVVLPLVKHPLTGAQVYGSEKKLDDPLKRIEKRLQEFAQDAFGNLIPTEPLN